MYRLPLGLIICYHKGFGLSTTFFQKTIKNHLLFFPHGKVRFLFCCFNPSPSGHLYPIMLHLKSQQLFEKIFYFPQNPCKHWLFLECFLIVSITPKILETCCIVLTLKPLENTEFFGNVLSFFYNRRNLFQGLMQKYKQHYIVESCTVSILSLFFRDFVGQYLKKVSEPIFMDSFRTQKIPTFNAHKKFSPYIHARISPIYTRTKNSPQYLPYYYICNCVII